MTVGSAIKRAVITTFIGANLIVGYYNYRESRTGAKPAALPKTVAAPATATRKQPQPPTVEPSSTEARWSDPPPRTTSRPRELAPPVPASASPALQQAQAAPSLPAAPALQTDAVVLTSATTAAIAFDSKSARLSQGGKEFLFELINRMSADNRINVQIAGYTEDGGDPLKSLELSSQRAHAVADYLEKQGRISSNRIAVQVFGSKSPVADNKTAAGRARNNRVEIIESREEKPRLP